MQLVKVCRSLQCILVHVTMFIDLNHQRVIRMVCLNRLGVGERLIEGYAIAMIAEVFRYETQRTFGRLCLVFVIADADVDILEFVRVGT